MSTDAPPEMSFNDFLERMSDPGAADLVRSIKRYASARSSAVRQRQGVA